MSRPARKIVVIRLSPPPGKVQSEECLKAAQAIRLFAGGIKSAPNGKPRGKIVWKRDAIY